MNGKLSGHFNLPPEWQVFAPLIKDIGDEESPIDVASVMERIIPVFRAYEEATQPRHYRIASQNKKTDPQETPHVFVLSRGLNERGSFMHRIVHVTHDGQLNVMDIDRLLDDAELFKRSALAINSKKIDALTKNYDARLRIMLDKGLPQIRRVAQNAARWVDDAAFVFSPQPFTDFTATHERIADQMMAVLGDMTGGQKRMDDYIRGRLILSLQGFEEKRHETITTLLTQAHGLLDAEAVEILSRNASTRTTGHYHWLTRDKSPERLALRRLMADACPVFLLTDNYAKAFQSHEKTTVESFDVDGAIARLLNIPASRVGFYKALRETDIGAANARRLPSITRYVEYDGGRHMTLETPEDWARAYAISQESVAYAQLLDRNAHAFFVTLAQATGEQDNDPRMQAQRLRDMRVLRDRFVTWGLVPKIVNEAKLRGMQVPVSHALFMASGYDQVERGLVANSLNKKQREAVDDYNGANRLINRVLQNAALADYQQAAAYYGTHHGEVDRQLRELIITNRLAEHGADYPWEGLPVVELSEERYTVIPRNSQADLLKDGLSCGHELWRRAPLAIIDGMHFVSLRRRGGITDATAIIHEPDDENPDWQLGDVYPSDSGRMFRNDYAHVFETYLRSPEFQDTVDLLRIRNTRRKLYETLSSRAQGHERLGLSDMGDIEERKLKLSILARFWPCRDGFEVDEFGCISSPLIDREIDRLMQAIAPVYPSQNRAERRPLPPLG